MPGNERSRPRGTGPANYTATNGTTENGGTAMLPDGRDAHCQHCACRCRCHRPPPEPPVIHTPRPGSWEWSGYLAGLSAELGSLAAAFEYVVRQGVAA